MRTLPYLWLDVFADRPFAGNALCVVLDGTSLTDADMQAIAKETNLSETTFVLPPTVPGATYRTRIFTPGGELAFAGHPTLGTAAAMALSGRVNGSAFVQETKSGLTPLELIYDGDRLDRVVMVAPRPELAATPDPAAVARTLGLTAQDVTPNGLRPEVIFAGVKHLVIPVASPEVLAGITSDTGALTALSRELGVIGAYPFALLPRSTDGQTDAYARARLFAPLFGISEDAATGSAAAPLGAYLHWHGLMPEGSNAFWYEQGIEMGRPSRLWVEVTEPGGTLRVRVGGEVCLLGKGEFHI
ncbi:MAG: PhzF family phenazine biosynthesis protein [Symbiobacteriaceae bacterium]|jgi:trans-2,3-dihydro-3-hydroxyanthranilate isomerase|nr:PhzF family phenazine biosynthesis protein [Symbiobacteriaceae bacterium]